MEVSSEQAYESLNKIVEFGGNAKSSRYRDIRKVIEERNRLLKIMQREEDNLIQELNELAEAVKNDILADARGDKIQDKLKRIGEINEYLRAIANAPSNYMTDIDK